MIAILWNESSQEQWQRHLSCVPYAAYQQHWAYGQMLAQLGVAVQRAEITHEGRTIGVVQIARRRYLRRIHLWLAMRGPVWLDTIDDATKAEAYRALNQTLPAARAWPKLRLWMPESDDDAALCASGLRCIISGYATALIELQQTDEALLEQMDGKWRNRLRAAQKQSLLLSAVERKPESYQWLLEEESKQAKRRNYQALPAAMVPLYQQQVGHGSLLVLQAQADERRVAGVVMLVHGNSATYHIGWSNEQGKQLGAHNLLLWEAIQRLRKNQIRTLDMGGIDTRHAEGLARFKLGLSGGKYRLLKGTYL